MFSGLVGIVHRRLLWKGRVASGACRRRVAPVSVATVWSLEDVGSTETYGESENKPSSPVSHLEHSWPGSGVLGEGGKWCCFTGDQQNL